MDVTGYGDASIRFEEFLSDRRKVRLTSPTYIHQKQTRLLGADASEPG